MDSMLSPIIIKEPSLVAVSGGVDSVVLLHLLLSSNIDNKLKLTVAHFDHGIRPNSDQDLRFVQNLAKKYGLQFVSDKAYLGPNASEDDARKARYQFFEQALIDTKLTKLITAHHQDDLIETGLINLIRGTKSRGLSAMIDNPNIKRPLLAYPKQSLIRYAQKNKLVWKEDNTNQDLKYLRNYLRIKIVPKMSNEQRQAMVKIAFNSSQINRKVEQELTHIFHSIDIKHIEREWYNSLDLTIQREIIAFMLRQHEYRNYSEKSLERLAVLLKVAQSGKFIEVNQCLGFKITEKSLALITKER
jgi:tRNA(Ile)-lysidine synthetase-like protein